jgi:hypothetical protein
MDYNRIIRMHNRAGATRVELEDDFHQFAIELAHDDERIVALRGTASRTPWSTCGGAPGVLNLLSGRRLDGLDLPAGERAEQCTHLLDMVELAVAHARRSEPARRYEISVTRGERPADPIEATLLRNGAPLLRWRVDATGVAAPPPYDGFPRQTIGQLKQEAVVAWCRGRLDADAQEAVLVMHRALFVSGAKYVDWQSPQSSAERNVPHFCFTHSAKRAAAAYATPAHFKAIRITSV